MPEVLEQEHAAPAESVYVWLKCRSCGRPLVRVSVDAGATCLELLSGQVIIREALIRCACGGERHFRSAPVSPPAHRAGGNV